MRSATSNTSFMLCEMMMTARPRSASRRTRFEHHRGLRDAERRGRLVHDHELRVPEHGLGDRHRLALPTRQRGDQLADRPDGRDRQTAQRLGGGLLHAAPRRGRRAASFSRPEEHVLDDVEVVAEREVLVHGLDPERRPRRGASGCGRGLPSQRISPGVRRVDPRDALDQHRLARRRCRRPAR